MKSIIKWFVALLLIIFCALLLYQNQGVLLDKKPLYLIHEDVFGFNYGFAELPLMVYFIVCILAGAFFMAIPALGLWIGNRRLRRQLRRTEQTEQIEHSLPRRKPDDDLAYIMEDE